MLFDPKNYPNLFIRGKGVKLWFTNIIRKNHAYNQRTKRLRDSSEGETLCFIIVYDLWKVFGKRQGSASDSSIEIPVFHFMFFVSAHKFAYLMS